MTNLNTLSQEDRKIIFGFLDYIRKVDSENAGPGVYQYTSNIFNIICARPEGFCTDYKTTDVTMDTYMQRIFTSNIYQELTSGSYHFHRGALGIEGRQLKKIFLSETAKLVKSGYITEEIAKEKISDLEEKIKNLG